MKKLLMTAGALVVCLASFAQADSTQSKKDTTIVREESDTIRIGGTIIIKKRSTTEKKEVHVMTHKKKRSGGPSTSWLAVDLGFANFRERSNYAAAAAQGMVQPGLTKDNLDLRTGKSVNVNVWLFFQRLPLVKKVVNLKYGLGVELNNYRFDNETVAFRKNPTFIALDNSYQDVRKNKLAADYVTVPMMLNFNLTPRMKYGFGFSGGLSAGYLYSSRQKIKNNDGGKFKVRDDFDLRRWKLAYVGELNLGPARLYGSYALKNMWEKGLDQRPYTVGIRLSHF
ncbi:outer membrane beta-barrel protein [Paraflavisolibacter sp. H34]|uniref:outer membrane beta-barrel protein n=1 Tax=Huijunlia imazamoxiresistens TaxID=3127457 RepID=UPI003019EE35